MNSGEIRLALGDSTATAYARGLAEGNGEIRDPLEMVAPANLRASEIRDACDSWKGAQTEHSETSYYGAAYIRQMRAYWLARRRSHPLRDIRAIPWPGPRRKARTS